jgi:hypothetical protein
MGNRFIDDEHDSRIREIRDGECERRLCWAAFEGMPLREYGREVAFEGMPLLQRDKKSPGYPGALVNRKRSPELTS